MGTLDKAIRIAAVAFEGKYDKGGHPYILHLLNVMGQVDQNYEELMIVAVLHDLIEDTDWTLKMLRDEGFSKQVVDNISVLTHKRGEPYVDYIKRIDCHYLSRAVKIADLRHNSDIHRMKGLRDKDFIRLVKYHKAYNYLIGGEGCETY